MKKIALFILTATLSAAAMADWVLLGGNDVQENYVDPGSIRKKGNNVTTLNMYHFKTVREYDGNEYRSSVLLYEFDCAKGQSRGLESIFYAESKGAGAIVDSWSTPHAWKAVPPATPLDSFMNFACKNN